MRTKEKRITPIQAIVAISICILVYIIFANIVVTLNKNNSNIALLSDGWSFYLNNVLTDKQPDEILSDFSFPNTKIGDVLRLEKVLSFENNNSTQIIFYTWHAVTKLYINDILFYTDGLDSYLKGQMLGSRRHEVSLPAIAGNQLLSIELQMTETNGMFNIMPIGFTLSSDHSALWFGRNLPMFFLGCAFIYIGIFVFLLGILLFRSNSSMCKLVYFGLFALLVGVYTLARSKFLELFFVHPDLYNLAEYICLFSIPIPVSHLFLNDIKEIKTCWIKSLYLFICIITPIFVFITVILHITNVIHISCFLYLYYVIVMLVIIFVSLFVLKLLRKSKAIIRRYFISIMIIFAGAFLSIVLFRLQYSPKVNNALHIWIWQDYVLIVANTLSVLFAAFAYSIEVRKLSYQALYSEMYEKIAYTDELTGLQNRRAADFEFEWLEENQNKTNYAVISIDLNNLKKLNDLKGHSFGDDLLQAFSNSLSAACDKQASSFRLGGDEFLVIIRDTNLCSQECILSRIQTEIKKEQLKTGIEISAAIGCALQGEGETVYKVFDLADKRMYVSKRAQKLLEMNQPG